MCNITVPVGSVTFHLVATSDVQTKPGTDKKGDRDQKHLKIYNAIILSIQFFSKLKEIPS